MAPFFSGVCLTCYSRPPATLLRGHDAFLRQLLAHARERSVDEPRQIRLAPLVAAAGPLDTIGHYSNERRCAQDLTCLLGLLEGRVD